MKIGPRIKQIRLERKTTLNEIAKKTGLTTSFLSQLERDLTSPSVVSLEKIAYALRVRIADFFQEGDQRDLLIIRKKAGKRQAAKKGDSFIETLASGVFDVNMNSQLFSLGPETALSQELTSFKGERFLMVLKGEIEFYTGKEKFLFEEGDSVYCAFSKSPTRIVNNKKTEAKVLYISFFKA